MQDGLLPAAAAPASTGILSRRGESVLGLHGHELLLLLLCVQLLEGLVGLVVEHHEVPVAHVEAGEVVARVLRVEDVLVHDERRATTLGGVAHSDLSEGERKKDG